MTARTRDAATAAAAPSVGGGYEEALAWLRARVVMTRAAWDALTQAARARAFMVSGVAQLDVIKDAWRAIDRAVENGTTLAQFKRDVGASLRDQWQGSVANPSARMECIFRNNVQAAYSAGRVEQMRDPDVIAVRPYWMFDAVLDGRTTEICNKLNGTILLASDPFWTTHQPILHHQCRSGIRSLRRKDAERRGITAKAPDHEAAEGFGGATWEPDLTDVPAPLREAHESRKP